MKILISLFIAITLVFALLSVVEAQQLADSSQVAGETADSTSGIDVGVERLNRPVYIKQVVLFVVIVALAFFFTFFWKAGQDSRRKYHNLRKRAYSRAMENAVEGAEEQRESEKKSFE